MMTELGELNLALDELGRRLAVEDDWARLALERLEGDGADLDRSDGMLAQCALAHHGTVPARCERVGRRGEDGVDESQLPLPSRDCRPGWRFSV